MSTILQFPSKPNQSSTDTFSLSNFASEFPACVAAIDRPVTLWNRSFPNVKTLTCDAEDGGLLGTWQVGHSNFARASAQCTVQVFRVGRDALDPKIAKRAMSSILSSAPNEAWNAPMRKGTFVGFIYEGSQVLGEPVGLLCFSLEMGESRGKIRSLVFNYKLLFVKPECRTRLFGRLASAAMGEWFLSCQLAGDRVSKSGFDLYYLAEIESRGGLICSQIMAAHLEILFDCQEELAEVVNWRIKSLDVVHEPPGGMFAAMPAAWTEQASYGIDALSH